MNDYELTLEYTSNKKINEEEFLGKDELFAFDTSSASEMKTMIQILANELDIKDEYGLKRLEVTLKYELPFFATNRRLVKHWIMENFIY